ncbi:metallophosphoesterase family protein [Methylobacter marinus]|uniref:metallophosphoesterase family protein n=1 Tax=Methylobacter marinus TaxID=34058 RepID=UPI00037E3FC5|nr:metallophosphoesterase [Methylobacter marinus]
MKIHLLSDLHNEIHPFTPSLHAQEADVVVLAGDIDIKARGIAWASETFSCPVIYVPGNHEYYKGHLDYTLAKMRAAACERVRVLDCDEWILGGMRFLGATGWTDYSATGNTAVAEWEAEQSMTDFKKIRVRSYHKVQPLDFIKRNERTRKWLRDRLSEAFDGLTVIVTHHAPSVLSLAKTKTVNHLDAAYANQWESLMGQPNTFWLHGHTHLAVDYTFQGSRVIANPRGYPKENTGFDPDLLIELEHLSIT